MRKVKFLLVFLTLILVITCKNEKDKKPFSIDLNEVETIEIVFSPLNTFYPISEEVVFTEINNPIFIRFLNNSVVQPLNKSSNLATEGKYIITLKLIDEREQIIIVDGQEILLENTGQSYYNPEMLYLLRNFLFTNLTEQDYEIKKKTE